MDRWTSINNTIEGKSLQRYGHVQRMEGTNFQRKLMIELHDSQMEEKCWKNIPPAISEKILKKKNKLTLRNSVSLNI